MISLPLRFLRAAAASLALAAVARAEPAIITKARAFVGPDAALNGIKSVHLVGTLSVTNTGDPGHEAKGTIDIIFQKPDQQRVVVKSETSIETTALDGYDGWRRVENLKDPTKWEQLVLGPDMLKGLRANTWENLDFFRGIESHGGTIEEQGSMSIDGVDCQKLVFKYTDKIYFYRYFEKTTGRLVFSQTGTGDMIREIGETRANGIRFPKSIKQITKTGTGQTQTTLMVFDKITVNEVFPASTFRVPIVGLK